MWIVLLAIGITVNVFIAPKQSLMVQILAFLLTCWQAFIYLYTALKNPGIATPQIPNDPESTPNRKNSE